MNQSETDTRQALIDAGRELFARHGFDGASVRMLTAQAGTNLGAITYHFGSKSALHDRVIDDTLRPFADAVIAAAVGPGPPLDRVEAVVRTYVAYLLEHPEIPRFLMQSVVLSDRPPAAAFAHLRRILSVLTALVTEGQAEGSIREGPPVVLALGMTSQAIHLSVVHRGLAAVTGLELMDESRRKEVVSTLVRYARSGLSPREGET